MSNLIGKTFNRTIGGEVRIVDVEGDVAILENSQRVNIDTLVNSGEFSEAIDMSLFTGGLKKGTGVAASALINGAKGISDDVLGGMNDSMPSTGTEVRQVGVVEDHMAAQSDNYERASNTVQDPRAVEALRLKAIELQQEAAAATNRQTNKMNQYLNDDEKVPARQVSQEPFVPGSQVNTDGSVDQTQRRSQPQQDHLPINQQVQVNNGVQPVDNPMTVMFKGFKRVNEFKCKLEINEMIPNLEMMRMFEDSYDLSIIDYFTDEILNKVSKDPNLLRKEIKKSLEIAIYGKAKSQPKAKPKADTRGYKKSRNKPEFLKALKNKGEVIALGTALKVKIDKTAKRGEIEKTILG